MLKNSTYHTHANKGCCFYSKKFSSALHSGAFHQISSIFTIKICTNFNKTHLFLVIIYVVAAKDLSKVKQGFKSVPLQIYFEIAGLARAEKWREIQNIVGEERF